MEKKKPEAIPTLIVKRVVRAKRDKVFQAWTNPEMMKDWFFAAEGPSVVTADVRINGKFRNAMGGPVPEKPIYVHTGEYLEIVPPEKVVFTWSSHLVKDTRVTVELSELEDSTEVKITHDLISDEEIRQKHNWGWDGCLANLALYLE